MFSLAKTGPTALTGSTAPRGPRGPRGPTGPTGPTSPTSPVYIDLHARVVQQRFVFECTYTFICVHTYIYIYILIYLYYLHICTSWPLYGGGSGVCVYFVFVYIVLWFVGLLWMSLELIVLSLEWLWLPFCCPSAILGRLGLPWRSPWYVWGHIVGL